VEANTGEYERTDKPVVLRINFTDHLNQLGSNDSFSKESIGVFEIDASGSVTSDPITHQFDESDDYDRISSASGTLTFLMRGTTPAGKTRRFEIRFGDTRYEYQPPSFTPLVSVEEIDEYEGDETFKITTQNAIYYYHKHGSGFASIVDADGNDWVGFHPTTEPGDGPRGGYRGIPNIAPAQFHPGRGDGKLPSKLIHVGPLKISILSETADRKWGCLWDVYPRYAAMTLFKKSEEPYWILYEGTPGGKMELNDYWVHSSGERLSMGPYHMPANQWSGKLPSPKWVYFGDGNMDRVLYMALHETHDVLDIFWHFGEGGMTVFGFGRGPNSQKDWQQLDIVPIHLTIGFAEDGEFRAASKTINDAYQDLRLSIHAPESR
jgi:hypothetical protein